MAAVFSPRTVPASFASGTHPPVPVLATEPEAWRAFSAAAAALPIGAALDGPVLDRAERARDLLPRTVHAALRRLRMDPGPAGALLIRGLPVGTLPATPKRPAATPPGKDRASELLLLTVARVLGEPVGYRPEHGGDLVQNLLPVREAAATQTSTSSSVDLEFHTETAFHPHRPRYLLLSCLRGDNRARTLLCSLRALLTELSEPERAILAQPRFRTRVDASFGGHPGLAPLAAAPILRGDPERPTLVFDADLMAGTDPEADAALARLRNLARQLRTAVTLEPGDLLVVDNDACIHGRSAFPARFDGSDRWLQRAFVVEDLAPSAADRHGRIIDTTFT